MRSFIFVLLAIWLMSMTLPAQNFKAVPVDKEVTFAHNDSLYIFSKVDSVRADGEDTLVYFNRIIGTWPGMPSSCDYMVDDTAFFGTYARFRPDSTWIFFNSNNDSVFLKSNVEESEVFRMYTYDDGTYLRAGGYGYAYDSFFPEFSDSSKRMRIRVFNAANEPQEDHPGWNKTLGLTENVGWWSIRDIRTFPEDFTSYEIKGFSNPDMGLTNLDAFQAFDYNTGDEFHFENYSISGNASDYEEELEYVKKFVQAKNASDDGDTLIYQMFRVSVTYLSDESGTYDTIQIIDTLEERIYLPDYQFLDALELTLHHWNMSGFSDFNRIEEEYFGRSQKDVYDFFNYDPVDRCLSNPTGIEYPENRFIEGLGRVHYLDFGDDPDYNEEHSYLIYFQKGLQVWGDRIDFDTLLTSIDEGLNDDLGDFYIFPNPVVNILNVQWQLPLSSSGEMQVFDINGSLVSKVVVPKGSDRIRLHLDGLSSGIYIFQIMNDEEQGTGKFVKY